MWKGLLDPNWGTGWCSLSPDTPLHMWFVVILGHMCWLTHLFQKREGGKWGQSVFLCTRIIIQRDSECATAEREREHQAVNPITLLRKMQQCLNMAFTFFYPKLGAELREKDAVCTDKGSPLQERVLFIHPSAQYPCNSEMEQLLHIYTLSSLQHYESQMT